MDITFFYLCYPIIQAFFLETFIRAFAWESQQFGFGPCPTQTGLCSYRKLIEALNLEFRKNKKCTIRVAKTKALISCAVTAQLICAFVFAYADCCFSDAAAQISLF